MLDIEQALELPVGLSKLGLSSRELGTIPRGFKQLLQNL